MRLYFSRVFSRTPYLFYFLKKLDLLFHHYFGRLHEPELAALRKLLDVDGRGVIVDIGANIGQSAIDFAGLFKNYEIISFEANKMLIGYLNFCRSLIGPRFDFRLHGISNAAKNFTLFVPKRGGVYIFGEASLDRAVLESSDVINRIGPFSIATVECDLIDFDSTGFFPDLIKIDVQGHELSVLQGMKALLSVKAPVLFIERSPADSLIMSFLSGYGYRFFGVDADGGLLPFVSRLACGNFVGVPSHINLPVN